MVPTNNDGTLNTEHRFYFEELPTLKALVNLAKSCQLELPTISKIIQYGEKLLGREVDVENPDLHFQARTAEKLDKRLSLKSKL